MQKKYISANQLLDDSFKLGLNILHSNFKPNFIVGIWRGGAPVAIAIQELLEYSGIVSDHISIRTSSYTSIDQKSDTVKVEGLGYLVESLKSTDRLLLVDDVFDTGRSIHQVIKNIHDQCESNTPEIRVATPYFKPAKNETDRTPNYYLYETDDWLVFPHELIGLSEKEILEKKPETEVLNKALALSNKR